MLIRVFTEFPWKTVKTFSAVLSVCGVRMNFRFAYFPVGLIEIRTKTDRNTVHKYWLVSRRILKYFQGILFERSLFPLLCRLCRCMCRTTERIKKGNIFRVVVITIFGLVVITIYGSREPPLEEWGESEKEREIKGRKDENNGIRPQRLGEWTTVGHKTI